MSDYTFRGINSPYIETNLAHHILLAGLLLIYLLTHGGLHKVPSFQINFRHIPAARVVRANVSDHKTFGLAVEVVEIDVRLHRGPFY